MTHSGTDMFTIGVFQNTASAARGLEALARQGFTPAVLSVIARASPDVEALATQAGADTVQTLELAGLGACHAAGALVAVLQGGDDDLRRQGLAKAMRRAGFQAHDGQIFEALTARGGVLVAVSGEARAADALAVLHNYGGGNAAIGAWHGRV